MTSGKAIDIKAFIDERPISPYQWLLVALCFLVVTADGMFSGRKATCAGVSFIVLIRRSFSISANRAGRSLPVSMRMQPPVSNGSQMLVWVRSKERLVNNGQQIGSPPLP